MFVCLTLSLYLFVCVFLLNVYSHLYYSSLQLFLLLLLSHFVMFSSDFPHLKLSFITFFLLCLCVYPPPPPVSGTSHPSPSSSSVSVFIPPPPFFLVVHPCFPVPLQIVSAEQERQTSQTDRRFPIQWRPKSHYSGLKWRHL